MPDTATPERARAVATQMAVAASDWLDALDPTQLALASGASPDPGPDDAERRRWFYTPTDHGGLTLHQQRPAQQRRAMRLVATGLSAAGYATVATVIGLENVLDHTEGFTATWGRERGRDPGLYYLRVFGEPGGLAPWGWRFGGHHISLNNLVVDGGLRSTTPCFLGADPASSPLLGGGVLRPLGAVEDLGRELFRSLSPELSRVALLTPRAPSDLVGGNRSVLDDGDTTIPLAGVWRGEFDDPAEQARLQAASDGIDEAAGLGAADHRALALSGLRGGVPKGVAGSDLDPGQREILLALIDTYLSRAPEGCAAPPDAAALDRTHLAWAGGTDPGLPHYYRVQGPSLLLEWDNTQRAVNHAHSVWRDPDGDFGLPAVRG